MSFLIELLYLFIFPRPFMSYFWSYSWFSTCIKWQKFWDLFYFLFKHKMKYLTFEPAFLCFFLA